METIGYRYFCNVRPSRPFAGYSYGDRVILAWEGEEPIDRPAVDILERLWVRFNRDDRPTGQICNSMSIGDIVVLAETAWSCTRDGWVVLDMPFKVLNRTWVEAHEDYERADKDSSLGVGHIWTTVTCPAYLTLVPSDCTCRNG